MEESNEIVRKTIKVEPRVYIYIEHNLRRGESFSDGLKRMLCLVPDLDTLMAYFDDIPRENVLEVIDIIRDVGHFDEEIIETEELGELHFYPRDGPRITIAKLSFQEDNAVLKYKDQSGELDKCFTLYSDRNMVDTERNELRKKVRGAVRRWCRDRADEVLKDDSR